MDRLQLGPASQKALRGFAKSNRVAGQEPLDAAEWQVALAAVGLMALASAEGHLVVVEECLRVLFVASMRSGAPVVKGSITTDDTPF